MKRGYVISECLLLYGGFVLTCLIGCGIAYSKTATERDIEIATQSLERVEHDIKQKNDNIERERRNEMESKAASIAGCCIPSTPLAF